MSETRLKRILDAEARGNWVRLRTLTSLRWVAIVGQCLAVVVTELWLGIALPLGYCALTISASVCFNIVAHLVHPAEKRLSGTGTFVSLLFDLVQVSVLLMLTGGLANPFALLILVPVTISATALRLTSTVALGVLALGFVALMTFLHLPLTQAGGGVIAPPELLIYGFAAALALGVVFFSLYARRVVAEAFRMSEALAATQMALAREQRLAAIGGIAAAAAHEMGTPLATIKLVAGELAREVRGQPELAEDVALIRTEAERCGRIMADLAREGRDDAHVRLAPISAVIEEAAAPHAGRIGRMVLRIDGAPPGAGGAGQPTVQRRPELIHGLRNLIQNAADFARSTVWIDVQSDETSLRIVVGDDGPGFGPDLLPRLGEPYVTTRARGAPRAAGDAYEGMGLGLFIARTLLERTGAQVSFANGSDNGTGSRRSAAPPELARPPGAVVELVWPAAAMVVAQSQVRAPLGANRPFAEL